MVTLVWDFLQDYGWFVTFGTLLAYSIYYYVLMPQIEQLRKAKQLERQKKFDESVHSRVSANLEAARLRQQRQHDVISLELKKREDEEREQRLKKLREELDKKSVLENALGSTTNKKLSPRPGTVKSAAEIIDEYIHSKPLVVFSKSNCPFCRKAKSVLATFRLPSSKVEYVELDERDDLPGESIQQEFIKRYGSRSVPKVFIDGKFIGGGDDTVQLFQQGVLEVLIKDAIQKV